MLPKAPQVYISIKASAALSDFDVNLNRLQADNNINSKLNIKNNNEFVVNKHKPDVITITKLIKNELNVLICFCDKLILKIIEDQIHAIIIGI